MTNDLISLKEIVLKLREKKEERKLSLDQIIELIRADNDGFAPSKSTLSKLFREGSENERFDYEDVIRPLARVLLDIETIEDTDTEDVKTLKNLLKVKMAYIKKLEAELDKIDNKHHQKLEKERAQFQKSLEFLKEQVAYKDKRMDLLLNAVKEKDTMHNKLLEHILSCPYKGCKQEQKEK